MGDNLKAASQFVTESKQALDQLILAPTLNMSATFDQLVELQRGAKIMHARAIYRAAQSAVDLIEKGQLQDKIQSELSTVRGLISQYESGLVEVLDFGERKYSPINHKPAQEAVTPQHNMLQQAELSPVGDMIADLNGQLSASLAESNEAQQIEPIDMAMVPNSVSSDLQTARSTLEPLIQYAQDGEQQDALRNLSRLYGQPLKANMAADSQTVSVEFEGLMPELTNIVLTTARHSEKTVSISYAANNVRLGRKMADSLRLAMIDMCHILVNRSLELSNIRRERGESGAGHIAIIADMIAGKISISLECTGRDVKDADCLTLNCQRLFDIGGHMKTERKGDRFCLNISDLPAYAHDNSSRGAYIMEHAS